MPSISAQCKGCHVALQLLHAYQTASTQENLAMSAELEARTAARGAGPGEKAALDEVATTASSALQKLTQVRATAEGGLNGTTLCRGFNNGQCGSA